MKSVKNFPYVEKTSAECNEDSYLAILHLSRVELHCKLQEKLHRVKVHGANCLATCKCNSTLERC